MNGLIFKNLARKKKKKTEQNNNINLKDLLPQEKQMHYSLLSSFLRKLCGRG